MNFKEALAALKEGKCIKLPEWKGYWKKSYSTILMHCEDGRILNVNGQMEDVFFTMDGIARDDWEIIDYRFNQVLASTRDMMISPDYKERFRAEYIQLKNRVDGLQAMVDRWDEGTLSFTPTCPRSIYDTQLAAMYQYLEVLKQRAVIEGISL